MERRALAHSTIYQEDPRKRAFMGEQRSSSHRCKDCRGLQGRGRGRAPPKGANNLISACRSSYECPPPSHLNPQVTASGSSGAGISDPVSSGNFSGSPSGSARALPSSRRPHCSSCTPSGAGPRHDCNQPLTVTVLLTPRLPAVMPVWTRLLRGARRLAAPPGLCSSRPLCSGASLCPRTLSHQRGLALWPGAAVLRSWSASARGDGAPR